MAGLRVMLTGALIVKLNLFGITCQSLFVADYAVKGATPTATGVPASAPVEEFKRQPGRQYAAGYDPGDGECVPEALRVWE